MSPVKLSYSIQGKERGSQTAEDGETAVLEIPRLNDRAFAKTVRTRFFGMKEARLFARFPGDLYPRSCQMALSAMEHYPLEENYITGHGEVTVKAEFIRDLPK